MQPPSTYFISKRTLQHWFIHMRIIPSAPVNAQINIWKRYKNYGMNHKHQLALISSSSVKKSSGVYSLWSSHSIVVHDRTHTLQAPHRSSGKTSVVEPAEVKYSCAGPFLCLKRKSRSDLRSWLLWSYLSHLIIQISSRGTMPMMGIALLPPIIFIVALWWSGGHRFTF